MGHSFDLECEECNRKFCQCHDFVKAVLNNGEEVLFCSESCRDAYKEFWDENKSPNAHKWKIKS